MRQDAGTLKVGGAWHGALLLRLMQPPDRPAMWPDRNVMKDAAPFRSRPKPTSDTSCLQLSAGQFYEGSSADVPEDALEERISRAGFSVSLGFHVVLLLVLALIGGSEEFTEPIVSIVFDASPADDLEDIEFEFPEVPETPKDALPPGVEGALESDVRMADLGVSPPVEVNDWAQQPCLPAQSFDGMPNLPAHDTTALMVDLKVGPDGEDVGDAGMNADIKFFGIKASGRRFVFVTDCSGSMEGPLLQKLKDELRKTVTTLPEAAEFYIVFFNHTSIPMPSPKCVRASKTNVQHFLAWADQVQSDGGTDPSHALEVALTLRPTTVFLLTDGVFDPAPTAEVINRLNRAREIRINTIAIGEQRAEPVLRGIAEANRGIYRFLQR